MKIEGLSHEGRGITHLDGKTTFVMGALPGEEVDIAITKRHSKYNEAKTLTVNHPSDDRVNPPCEYFGTCGGCRLQHIHPDRQILYKQQWVLELLQRIAKMTPSEVLPPLKCASLGYRTKARLGVRYVIKKEKMLVGFRELEGRYQTEMDRCVVLHPSVGEKITELADFLKSLSIFMAIPQLEIAAAEDATAIIIRHLEPFSPNDLILIQHYAIASGFHIYFQSGNTSTVFRFWPQEGLERLTYTLPNQEIKIHYHPCDFTQVNLEINAKMVDQAIELLQLNKNDQVLDLFCGLGNFTLPIARHVQSVIGVEGSQLMVERGYENAKLNSIDNVTFYATDLTQPQAASWVTQPYSKLLLDPPRCGAIEILPHIKNWQPERIVYVSCHPATFARDAAELANLGYSLKKLGVMDMFPHTQHVETIGLFLPG